MNALNALATGDFRALMDGLLSDDRIEGTFPCPCGQDNDVIIVRTGCVVVMWTNAATVHGADMDTCFNVRSYRSVADAMDAMDAYRAETDSLRESVAMYQGMTQLLNAIGDGGAIPGDFMVI